MNSAAPVIVPIFATPFAVVATGTPANLNTKLAALFRERATEERRDPALPRDPFCFRSREDLFEWDLPEVGQLRADILAAVCATAMSVSGCSEAEFDALRVQARGRFAIVRPEGCIPASTAPMASWYGLYCVTAPSEAVDRADSAVLRLYGIRQGMMFKDAANWVLRSPYGDSHYLWRPVSGQMAVFPASILHEVALNRANGDLVLVMARVRFAHGDAAVTPPW